MGIHDPNYTEPEAVIQSFTPLFWVNSKGSLDSYKLLPLVQTLSVSAKLDNGTEQVVAPFGDIGNITDQLDAIAMAKQILEEVLTCDPIYNSAEII